MGEPHSPRTPLPARPSARRSQACAWHGCSVDPSCPFRCSHGLCPWHGCALPSHALFRIVRAGMNKMTINHYIRATKKYREKTKIEKIRELLPKLHAGSLVPNLD